MWTWTRLSKEEQPQWIGDVVVLAAWRRPDGLTVIRTYNSWHHGRAVYSICQDEEFWRDKKNARRSWSDLGECRKAADRERPFNGSKITMASTEDAPADPPPSEVVLEDEPDATPPTRKDPPATPPRTAKPKRQSRRAAQRGAEDDRAAAIRAYARKKDITYGDVVEKFGLSDPQEAIQIIHGGRS